MAYIYDLTDTWSAAGTVFNGIKLNVTNSASASGSKLMTLQIGGTEFFGVSKEGDVRIGNGGDLRLGSATGTTAPTGDSSIYNDANDMIFATGTTTAERMRITSGGNLGIGTNSPATKLDINGDVTVRNGGGITIGNIQNNDGWYDFGGSANVNGAQMSHPGTLRFLTNSSERMRVNSSGNVGIGTSSPSSKLTVAASNVTVNAGYGIAFTGDQTRIMTPEDNVYGALINWGSAGGCRFIAGTSERMRIDGVGNVGIGTSGPRARLQTSGGAALNAPSLGSATNAPFYVTSSDPGYGLITGVNASDGHVFLQAQRTDGTATAYNITLNEAGGNVMVGTTTSFGKFSVFGTSGFNADSNAAISGSGAHKFRGAAGTTTISTYDYLNYTAMQFIRDNGNPTNTVGSITCTDGSTSYNTSSDRRLKKDVIPAPDAGAIVDSIEIISHGWKSNDTIVPFGVIAQDLNEVAPQAVHAGDDGEEIDSVWGVDYSKLVPMLIKEVQSLRARVAQLEGN